ncbi:hypothetical protein C6499_03905 [Candidatus Poribacteria bacterium]|nr:MAG: hypothetical protein C6499_03905 [Candidatus Poribacteria bacterium]
MNNPRITSEIFTSEERDENEERKRELIDLVASGEAVLMVGSGSSVRVGYVTWNGLLRELENLANECSDGFVPYEGTSEDELLEYLESAEHIKSHIRNKTGDLGRYYALLQNLFSPKDPPFEDFHRKLVSLPFRGILTTNYDTVLEAALGELEPPFAYDNSFVIDENSAGRVHEFLMAMNNDKRITRRIAHLHGKFDTPSNIILNIEDYYRAYGLRLTTNHVQRDSEWTLYRKLLWAVLATRRVVFIGFSMTDPYFNKMLETVSADLWRWDKSIHFAIMSISSTNAENLKTRADGLRREYGVDTIFYEDSDNSHQGLDRILDEIGEACKVRNQPETDDVE